MKFGVKMYNIKPDPRDKNYPSNNEEEYDGVEETDQYNYRGTERVDEKSWDNDLEPDNE